MTDKRPLYRFLTWDGILAITALASVYAGNLKLAKILGMAFVVVTLITLSIALMVVRALIQDD